MFFRFTTAGESHGKALVAIVEGLPAGMPIDIKAVNHELWRRQQGYGRGGRMKIEKDEVEILSGVRHGNTLGSPVALMIENKDFVHWQEVMSASERSTKKPDREGGLKNNKVVKRPRPGHADLAGGQKFGARDLRNVLERASARETAARVAAGALAKQLLAQFGVEVLSHVVQLGGIPAEPLSKTWDELCGVPDDSPLRCTDGSVQTEMMVAIDLAKEKGDTLGGVYEVVAKNVPVGLGSHTSWNEKLDGRIAQAFMSIHATKAVEIGTGVANVSVPGSQVHDEIFWKDGGGFVRRTNRAGGLGPRDLHAARDRLCRALHGRAERARRDGHRRERRRGDACRRDRSPLRNTRDLDGAGQGPGDLLLHPEGSDQSRKTARALVVGRRGDECPRRHRSRHRISGLLREGHDRRARAGAIRG